SSAIRAGAVDRRRMARSPSSPRAWASPTSRACRGRIRSGATSSPRPSTTPCTAGRNRPGTTPTSTCPPAPSTAPTCPRAAPRDLEDTYLPAFRAAIVEGGAGSVMCAYNRVDGQPACASDLLLKDILRDAWAFKGYVVSDCDAVNDIRAHHHYAPDAAAAVAAALRAGVDNECSGATLTDTEGLEAPYREALARGLATMADIDRALVRLFAARYRTGDLPGLRPMSVESASPDDVGSPEHAALALEAAEKSLVLLKNDGILPLRADARVAVVGPLGDATRVLRGNYSSPQSAPPVSVFEGLGRA